MAVVPHPRQSNITDREVVHIIRCTRDDITMVQMIKVVFKHCLLYEVSFNSNYN